MLCSRCVNILPASDDSDRFSALSKFIGGADQTSCYKMPAESVTFLFDGAAHAHEDCQVFA
jgi:hypothetical protein